MKVKSVRCLPPDAPVGIPNKGNTCYLNSVIQMMVVCREYEQYKGSPLLPFFNALRKGHVIPAVPRILVARSFREFNNHLQHDAHEYLLRLLETTETCGASNLFDGTFEVTVHFPDCNHSNVHTEPFRTLSMETGPDLESAFRSFLSPVHVQSTCDTCNDGTTKPANRHLRVQTWPTYLIVQFKRFTNRLAKKNDRMQIPSAWRDYDLCATIQHIGSTSQSGHYTACVKKNKKWYLCNDNKVIGLEERHVIRAAEVSYMVLYCKK